VKMLEELEKTGTHIERRYLIPQGRRIRFKPLYIRLLAGDRFNEVDAVAASLKKN